MTTKAIHSLLMQSNDIHYQLLGGDDDGSTMIVVLIVLVLAIGGRMLSSWIAGRGQSPSSGPPITGPFGGTLCPKCGRPFALHVWGFNVLVGKYDRCPHCRHWSLVRRQPFPLLQSVAKAEEETAESEEQSQLSEEEKWRQQLDNSRFDDKPPSS